MYKYQHNKGYTLLFSVIVSSIVLSIAAFILSVSRKQFILSSAARDSTVAVYAADSGIQCAVQAFHTGNLATSTTVASIYCDGRQYLMSFDNDYGFIKEDPSLKTDDGFKTSRLENKIVIQLHNKTCAIVDVIHGYYQNGTAYGQRTIIDSSGYNISDSGPCDTTNNPVNPRAVERSIRLQYNH